MVTAKYILTHIDECIEALYPKRTHQQSEVCPPSLAILKNTRGAKPKSTNKQISTTTGSSNLRRGGTDSSERASKKRKFDK